MVLAECDDEWQDGRRYFRPETIAAIEAVDDREEVAQRGPSLRVIGPDPQHGGLPCQSQMPARALRAHTATSA